MIQANPVEHKNFVIIATANENSDGRWRGAFNISANGKIIKEEQIRNAVDSRDSAEQTALAIAKVMVDEISTGSTAKIRYLDCFVKINVNRVTDGTEGARWHALVTIENATGTTSAGFIEAPPAGRFADALLAGLKAGEEAIDEQKRGR